MSSSSSSSSLVVTLGGRLSSWCLAGPRGGRSSCRCLALLRRPQLCSNGRFLLGSPPPPWAFSLSRLSYSAFCCTTRYSTLLQLERSWPLVRWILQYCLSEPSCLSAAATGAGSLPEPPACACSAGASLPDSSTASTSFLFFLLLFRRWLLFAGAVSSLSLSPAPASSPGSLLPSSARAHLSARAYSSLTSRILVMAISSRMRRLRTFWWNALITAAG